MDTQGSNDSIALLSQEELWLLRAMISKAGWGMFMSDVSGIMLEQADKVPRDSDPDTWLFRCGDLFQSDEMREAFAKCGKYNYKNEGLTPVEFRHYFDGVPEEAKEAVKKKPEEVPTATSISQEDAVEFMQMAGLMHMDLEILNESAKAGDKTLEGQVKRIWELTEKMRTDKKTREERYAAIGNLLWIASRSKSKSPGEQE